MLSGDALWSILPTIPRRVLSGPWARVVQHHLLHRAPPGAPAGSPPRPLWPGGPRLKGARYTPRGGFDAVYLASDPVTALMEVQAVFETSPRFTVRTNPWAVLAVEGSVTDMLDLLERSTCDELGTSLQELTGAWVRTQQLHLDGRGPLPPTQLLGQAAYETGVIKGLRFPSAKKPDGFCLVIFSDRLTAGGASYLQVFDEHGELGERLPSAILRGG